jgi:hypothetical protein
MLDCAKRPIVSTPYGVPYHDLPAHQTRLGKYYMVVVVVYSTEYKCCLSILSMRDGREDHFFPPPFLFSCMAVVIKTFVDTNVLVGAKFWGN